MAIENKKDLGTDTAEHRGQGHSAASEEMGHMQYSYGSKQEKTIITVKGQVIGGDTLAIMAGPCAIDNEDELYRIAKKIEKAGARFLRGAIYKPRTSPYSFQGVGDEGIRILKSIRNHIDLAIISEVTDISQVEKVHEAADILQIGARNMQNFELLKAIGRLKKPVLLKRGFCSTIQEWLMAAEYILVEGNPQVILCERGIRTFETETRNTLDISSVPLIKYFSHLPIIVDPSHGTGKRMLVEPMAKAAVVAGADGLMIEVHISPDCSISDRDQTISTEDFSRLMEGVRRAAAVAGRAVY